VSIDGSVLRVDNLANAVYYRTPAPGQPATVPPSAAGLVNQVATYCGSPMARPPGTALQQPVLARAHATSQADALRNQLAQIGPELYKLLDKQWAAHLALPAEVFTGKGHPPPETLRRSLARFDAVAKDPRYRTLTQRPEFQSTYGLLRHYLSARSQDAGSLQLPPPPVETGAATNQGPRR
jgi:hypothetical protein